MRSHRVTIWLKSGSRARPSSICSRLTRAGNRTLVRMTSGRYGTDVLTSRRCVRMPVFAGYLLPAALIDRPQKQCPQCVVDEREKKSDARSETEVEGADAVHRDAADRERDRTRGTGDDIRDAHVPAARGLRTMFARWAQSTAKKAAAANTHRTPKVTATTQV